MGYQQLRSELKFWRWWIFVASMFALFSIIIKEEPHRNEIDYIYVNLKEIENDIDYLEKRTESIYSIKYSLIEHKHRYHDGKPIIKYE